MGLRQEIYKLIKEEPGYNVTWTVDPDFESYGGSISYMDRHCNGGTHYQKLFYKSEHIGFIIHTFKNPFWPIKYAWIIPLNKFDDVIDSPHFREGEYNSMIFASQKDAVKFARSIGRTK